MNRKLKSGFTWIAAMIVVVSCINFSGGLSEAEKLQTAVVQTIAARDAVADEDVEPDQGDDEQAPADNIVPTDTPEGPPTETPKPCNQADFVSETIPDGTEYDPGESFTKTWRFKNTGTCTWNTDYKLKFKSGDQMGGASSKNMPNSVAPGETVDLSVNLTAPASSGTYKGVWRLVSNDDEEMIHNIWAEIVVSSPAFAVTSVNLIAIPPAFTGPCPFPFTFNAEITTNGPGTVSYYWKRSDSLEYGHDSIVFGSAGTQTVTIVSIMPVSGLHWMKIYIDNPNHQFFGPVNFHLGCL